MTRYERLKEASINEVAACFCYFFSEIEDVCKCCPARDKCEPGKNGMKEFLEEESE